MGKRLGWIVLLLSLVSCTPAVRAVGVHPAAVPASAAERRLAAGALEDVALQRPASFRAKTLPTFREKFGDAATEKALHGLIENYGTPVTWHYEGMDVGEVHLQDGTKLPLHRLFFSITTTKHIDHLFAFVDLVPHESRPALLSVSFVWLPKGLSDQLGN